MYLRPGLRNRKGNRKMEVEKKKKNLVFVWFKKPLSRAPGWLSLLNFGFVTSAQVLVSGSWVQAECKKKGKKEGHCFSWCHITSKKTHLHVNKINLQLHEQICSNQLTKPVIFTQKKAFIMLCTYWALNKQLFIYFVLSKQSSANNLDWIF